MRKETLIGSLINYLGGAIFGYNVGIVSGLAPALIQCTLFDSLDSDTLSVYQGLFNSLIWAFAAIGSPLGISIGDKCGLKTSLIVMCVLEVILPIVSALGNNFWYVLVTRSLGGIPIGFATAVSPIYSSAIVAENVKGTVGSITQLSVNINILLGELATLWLVPTDSSGACVPVPSKNWRAILIFPAIYAILCFITLMFGTNPYPGGKKAEDAQTKDKNTNDVKKESHHTSIFTRSNFKWRLLAVMIAVMNQLTGINGVFFYANQILQQSGVSNPMVAQIFVVGVWDVITIIPFMFIVDKVKRRTLLVLSFLLMLAGDVILVIGFKVKGFMSIIGMMLFILGFATGAGPFFFIIASQDFPSEIAEQGSSIANVMMWVLNIIIAFFVPVLISNIGGSYTFIILGAVQVLCLFYFGLAMPRKVPTLKVTKQNTPTENK